MVVVLIVVAVVLVMVVVVLVVVVVVPAVGVVASGDRTGIDGGGGDTTVSIVVVLVLVLVLVVGSNGNVVSLVTAALPSNERLLIGGDRSFRGRVEASCCLIILVLVWGSVKGSNRSLSPPSSFAPAEIGLEVTSPSSCCAPLLCYRAPIVLSVFDAGGNDRAPRGCGQV